MHPLIKEKIEALKKFKNEVPKLVIQLAAEEEARIIDWNTFQLEQGIENTGQQITPFYTPFTVQIKKEKGQPSDRVTLKDTGDFHQSFFLVVNPTSIAVYARDEKTLKIERKYGKEIWGLTDVNLQQLIDLVKPKLQELFANSIP